MISNPDPHSNFGQNVEDLYLFCQLENCQEDQLTFYFVRTTKMSWRVHCTWIELHKYNNFAQNHHYPYIIIIIQYNNCLRRY